LKENDDNEDERIEGDDSSADEQEKEAQVVVPEPIAAPIEDDDDPDDPLKTVPLPRYNTMVAVLKKCVLRSAAPSAPCDGFRSRLTASPWLPLQYALPVWRDS
jgi:hypothetical protein